VAVMLFKDRAIMLVLVASLYGPLAQAQGVAPRAPSGTFERDLRAPAAPVSSAQPTFRIVRPSAGDASAGEVTFNVARFDVQGARVIPAATIQAALARYTGRTQRLADVFGAADVVTKLYGDSGYALSFALIPEQDVVNGTVILKVVEGTVDAVDIEIKDSAGLVGRDRLKAALADRFGALVNTGPVRLAAIERAVLTTSDLGGLDVTIVVRPSLTTDGAARLLVVADLKPVSLEVLIDNHLREDFGDYRFKGEVRVNSLAVPGDQLAVEGRTTGPTNGFSSARASYQAPVLNTNLIAKISYFRGDTSGQNGLLSLLEFEGREEVASVGISWAAKRTRAASLFLGLDLNATNSSSGIFGVTLIEDHIRTLEASAMWDWASEDGAAGLIRVAYIQGLDGLDATKGDNPLRSRTLGGPDFSALTASFNWRKPLDGLGEGTAFAFGAGAQSGFGGGALAAGECSYGGEQFGSAYDAGAFGGEHCLKLSGELSRQYRFSFVALQPFIVVDGAIVAQAGALDFGEERISKAWSAGIGTRVATALGVSGEFSVHWPGDVEYAGGRSSDPKVLLSLGLRN
jgi:hemolysin activation/secretion protein